MRAFRSRLRSSVDVGSHPHKQAGRGGAVVARGAMNGRLAALCMAVQSHVSAATRRCRPHRVLRVAISAQPPELLDGRVSAVGGSVVQRGGTVLARSRQSAAGSCSASSGNLINRTDVPGSRDQKREKGRVAARGCLVEGSRTSLLRRQACATWGPQLAAGCARHTHRSRAGIDVGAAAEQALNVCRLAVARGGPELRDSGGAM
jgi:hypothetical protein